jgi:hypothetical protein
MLTMELREAIFEPGVAETTAFPCTRFAKLDAFDPVKKLRI